VSSSLLRVLGCGGERSPLGLARFFSLLFALVRGEGWRSPAQEGIRGWGRHLRSDPGTAVKATFALTHPVEPARDAGTHRVSFDGSDRERGGAHRQ
jgi:hypothetical protein